MPIKFYTVPDTNIIISAQTGNPNSPNKEYFQRWFNDEFILLYSEDTLSEYLAKLDEFGFPETKIRAFLGAIMKLGVKVEIQHYHLHVYPDDQDDIAFVLCADNGKATHLISYDKHLLDLQYRHEFSFKICKIVEFLKELRKR